MKDINKLTLFLMIVGIISMIGVGCKTSKTIKGTAIGAGGGGVIGAVVGRAAGNTALGALIGATVGGAAGAVVGRQMDKQAEEIKNRVAGAEVYRVGEGIIVEFNDKILFGFDKSNLNAGAKDNLNSLVTVLNKYPDTNIEIQGHTDNTGTDNYNMKLSKRRAASVSNYLSSKGISSRRTSTKGYGEKAPNYSNDSEDTRSQNRRVEFLITADAKMREAALREAEGK